MILIFFSSSKNIVESSQNNDDSSDLEENAATLTMTMSRANQLEHELEELEQASKHNKKISGPKQRTISTLSDFANLNAATNESVPNSRHNHTSRHETGGGEDSESTPGMYYRLASVGQDNQICFWDLTDDVLRERPAQAVSAASSSHYRSRATSAGTVVAAAAGGGVGNTSLTSNTAGPIPATQSAVSVGLSNQKQQASNGGGKSLSGHHHHHSTASSLVSTARNLFSKHSSGGGSSGGSGGNQKYEQSVDGDDTSSSSSIIKTSSLSSGMNHN